MTSIIKNPACIIATGLLAYTLPTSAQDHTGIKHRAKHAHKEILDKQANLIFDSAKPAVVTAAKSTVTISQGLKRLAFGTAISAEGKILTKWSEISPAYNHLIITTPDGKKHTGSVSGIYKEHDLAIVKCNAELTPIKWATHITPQLGDFIALAAPSGEVDALGVVSVQARSLLERDKAYLGVRMDFKTTNNGILLTEVIAGSAAAKAGLRKGDRVIAIDQKKIQGAEEMRNILQRLVPGSEVRVLYRRGLQKRDTKVFLGSRADTQEPQSFPQARMARMQRLGTTQSKVRDNFPAVIQSDMVIKPNQAGAPVVDLDGNVIGLSIARSSRIKTFIIPSSTILGLLTDKNNSYSTDLTPNLASTRNESAQLQPRYTRPHNKLNNNDIEQLLMSEILKYLGTVERNNEANEDNLQTIQEALRKISQKP